MPQDPRSPPQGGCGGTKFPHHIFVQCESYRRRNEGDQKPVGWAPGWQLDQIDAHATHPRVACMRLEQGFDRASITPTLRVACMQHTRGVTCYVYIVCTM